MDNMTSRRHFLVAAPGTAAMSIPAATAASATGMPLRPLGATGVRVSILGIGGHHIGRPPDENDGIRIIHTAMDEGITFMDNAWEYNNGRSEEIMGKALAMDGRRAKAFLMTKVCARDYKGAMQQIEESLKRLQTDHLDLLQFHECNFYNDPDWIFERGCLRAVELARQQGKVRFIGFTGHKAPAIHLKMLARNFRWDTCQMPNNVMDARFVSFRAEVMPVCQKKQVGIIGMKGCGGDGGMLTRGSLTVEECYRYCLSQPVAVQVVGLASLEHLQEAVRIGRSFQPLSQAEMTALMERVKEPQGDGRFEQFKTTNRYESAYHRAQHGFETQNR